MRKGLKKRPQIGIESRRVMIKSITRSRDIRLNSFPKKFVSRGVFAPGWNHTPQKRYVGQSESKTDGEKGKSK